MGLTGDGHGGWYDKKGEFVAKTDKGQLKFYNRLNSGVTSILKLTEMEISPLIKVLVLDLIIHPINFMFMVVMLE